MKWFRLAQSVIVIALISVLAVTISLSWATIQGIRWQALPLSLATVVGLAIFPLSIYSWQSIMQGLGYGLTYPRAARIWLTANSTRLIPGTVWQYASRVVLARRLEHIPSLTTATSMVFEMLVLLISGFLVSTLALFWINVIQVPWQAILGVLIIGCIFLIPAVLTAVVQFIKRLTHKEFAVAVLPMSTTGQVVGIDILHFLANGAVLTLLFAATGHSVALPSLLVFSGMYAFAWAVGYLTFLAPGGLGVSDATLAGLLTLYVPPAEAAVLALLMRVIVSFSEIVSFATLVKWRKNIR